MTAADIRGRVSSHRKRDVDCAKCGRHRTDRGRGLCANCHDVERHHGRLDQWKPRKPDTQTAVLPHYLAGEQPAQIAARLGITRNAANCAVRALRRKGVHPMTPRTDSLWSRLYVPAPSVEPECKYRHWEFVDWLEGNTRHLMRDGAPDVWAQPMIADALAVCARCPLHEWCVEAAAPQSSKAALIAGGAVWHDGEVVWSLADQEALEAAQDGATWAAFDAEEIAS